MRGAGSSLQTAAGGETCLKVGARRSVQCTMGNQGDMAEIFLSSSFEAVLLVFVVFLARLRVRLLFTIWYCQQRTRGNLGMRQIF